MSKAVLLAEAVRGVEAHEVGGSFQFGVVRFVVDVDVDVDDVFGRCDEGAGIEIGMGGGLVRREVGGG